MSKGYLARRVLLLGGLSVTAAGALGAVRTSTRSVPGAPLIAGTQQWGARPPQGPIEVLDTPPNKIIVHHTAGLNSTETSQEHAFRVSREIQDLHMDANGWYDTGQNFTNSRGGWITEGRHESLGALSGGTRHVVGAHAGAQNSVSLGIENEGLYTDVDVPQKLWESLVSLCAYMVNQYNLAAGEIYGHRDYMATECPGEVFYGRLSELREDVGAATGRPVVHPLTWPLLRLGASGPSVTAVQYLLRFSGAAVPVDGVFGAETARAAGEFAASRRVETASCAGSRVDPPGLFGGAVWGELAPVLGVGSSGDAVRAAQVLLMARGHFTGVDGVFGQRLVTAVRGFQRATGTAVSGVVSRETWMLLVSG